MYRCDDRWESEEWWWYDWCDDDMIDVMIDEKVKKDDRYDRCDGNWRMMVDMIDVMITEKVKNDGRYDRCDGKWRIFEAGLYYCNSYCSLPLGTGIVTTAIAFSAEERVKADSGQKIGIASFFQIWHCFLQFAFKVNNLLFVDIQYEYYNGVLVGTKPVRWLRASSIPWFN